MDGTDPRSSPSAAARLRAAADRLVVQVSHWSQGRWRQPAAGAPPATRADLVAGLVQSLADLGADAEGRAHRAVPRLDNDLVLVDQVRVMVLDLVLRPAPDHVLDRATQALSGTRAAL